MHYINAKLIFYDTLYIIKIYRDNSSYSWWKKKTKQHLPAQSNSRNTNNYLQNLLKGNNKDTKMTSLTLGHPHYLPQAHTTPGTSASTAKYEQLIAVSGETGQHIIIIK